MHPIRPAVRRRLSAGARREQILDVAHGIVVDEGFHAATPARIAEQAGITRPVLYQQFGDLAGLFVALIDRERDRAAAQFAEAVAAEHSAGASGDSPLVRTFAGTLRAIDENPATWRLFLIPPQGAPPQLHERLLESQELVHGYLQEQLEEMFPAMPDPDYTARMVQASGGELLRLRLTDPEHATTERIIALIRHISKRFGR